MKKIWLLCLLLIIPFCFIGCSNGNNIRILDDYAVEFTADKDYFGGIDIYFSTIEDQETYLKTDQAIYYMFSKADGKVNSWSIYSGDKIRFGISDSSNNYKTSEVYKIKIVSKIDNSIYYEQVIN